VAIDDGRRSSQSPPSRRPSCSCDKGVIGATQRTICHQLRRAGNAAVDVNRGDANEALHQLRMARELAIGFQRSLGNDRRVRARSVRPTVAAEEARAESPALHDALARLREQLAAHAKEAAAAKLQLSAGAASRSGRRDGMVHAAKPRCATTRSSRGEVLGALGAERWSAC